MTEYTLSPDNQNYPVFLFMAVIVALFIGLTVSAEEIFRDRKILEREKFLNLSRLSYLISKINLLFTLSAIQTLSFILVASLILEVRGMLFQHWIILFSTACFGNMLGLNVSAGMRSAVSIYILIPLILVPQLLLGGAMIKFDELHRSMSRKIYVPVVGDIMATRWAYEAMSVEQFKSNRFEKPFFNYDMKISQNDWYSSFLLPTLKSKINELMAIGKDPDFQDYSVENLKKITFHINDLSGKAGVKPGDWMNSLNYKEFNEFIAGETKSFLDSLSSFFRAESRAVTYLRNELYQQISSRIGEEEFIRMRETNYNENLADMVMNRMTKKKIYDAGRKYIQKADPIFMDPGSITGRAHFYAPYKRLGALRLETLTFNVIVIWIMIIFLFVTLYYNLLKKFIAILETLRLPILRRYGRDLLQT